MMKSAFSVAFSAAMAANPEWLRSSITEKTAINGISFEEFVSRRTPRNLRSAAPDNSEVLENCDVRFELAINQDVSGSFASVLQAFRENIGDLLDEVKAAYPGSRAGFSTFTDKPIPISGFGDHGDYPDRYIRDHCYKLRSPLTSDGDALRRSIADAVISGGGDYKENILGSFVSIGNDNAWGFTEGLTGGHGDDTAMIRVVLSTTDALPHVAGDAAANAKKWNAEWATENMEDAWTLHYGQCRSGGDTFTELVNLRSKHEADTLSSAESDRFDSLREQCGPWHYRETFAAHASVVDTTENCLTHEYPTVSEAIESLKKIDAVVPVLVTPSANIGLSYVQYYGNCPSAQTESECLREHYQSLFADAGMNGLFYSLKDESKPSVNDIVLFALDSIKYLYCKGELFPTTTRAPSTAAPVTTVPTTSSSSADNTTIPVPVTTAESLLSTTPVSQNSTPECPECPHHCHCVGNVCPCADEFKVHVGLDVPVSKWRSFVNKFGSWIENQKAE